MTHPWTERNKAAQCPALVVQ